MVFGVTGEVTCMLPGLDRDGSGIEFPLVKSNTLSVVGVRLHNDWMSRSVQVNVMPTFGVIHVNHVWAALVHLLSAPCRI